MDPKANETEYVSKKDDDKKEHTSEKKEKKEKKDKKEHTSEKKEKKDKKEKKEKKSVFIVPTWSNPVILPGPGTPFEQTTLSPPELGTFSTSVYLAFRAASNDAVWINFSSDGATWPANSSYAVINGSTSANIFTLFRPSLASYNSNLYLAYTNKADSSIQLLRNTSPNSATWTTVTAPSLPATAISGPTITTFNNGKLYLAYTDSANKIQVAPFDGTTNTWGTFATVKDTSGSDYKTTDGPCLMGVTSGSINYRLYISFRSVNATFFGYATLLSNGNVKGWTPQTLNMSSPFSIIDTPQVTQYNNDFFMAVSGPKNDIQYGSSANEGVTWGSWGSIENATYGSPAVIQKGNILTMAFMADSNNPSKSFVMTAYTTSIV